MNIWEQLKSKSEFLVLAPMDDVTDTVFREIVARTAPADLAMTEFASVDGFMHPVGRASVERRLRVTDSEREAGVPVIAQIWGSNPENYYQTAKELSRREDFVGIDINMGCPEKGIVKRGCCGGLIKEENWERASDIIEATKLGAGDLPVSVKTRIGLNQVITEEWCGFLLSRKIAALTIHARTVKEMSRVPARWDEVAKVVKLRDRLDPQTVVVGNGDVENRHDAVRRSALSDIDGVMIGRGVLRDIEAFSPNPEKSSPTERVDLLVRHLDLYEKTWGDSKPFDPMKKFAKLYLSGFPGAAELRARIMKTRSADEARRVLSELSVLV